MHTIYKYPITLVGFQPLLLPRGAQVLTIQNQTLQIPNYLTEFGGYASSSSLPSIALWAIIDPEERENETRVFEMYLTGKPVPEIETLKYISTVQHQGLVFHFFERVKEL